MPFARGEIVPEDVTKIAQRWSALSNKSRSRLLQKLTTEQKQALRVAVRALTAHAATRVLRFD